MSIILNQSVVSVTYCKKNVQKMDNAPKVKKGNETWTKNQSTCFLKHEFQLQSMQKRLSAHAKKIPLYRFLRWCCFFTVFCPKPKDIVTCQCSSSSCSNEHSVLNQALTCEDLLWFYFFIIIFLWLQHLWDLDRLTKQAIWLISLGSGNLWRTFYHNPSFVD